MGDNNKFLTGMYSILEKQGVGVLIVVVILAWMSGILPFKLFCLPPETAEEKAKQVAVLQQVTQLLQKQTEALDRIDKRDHIEKCSRILDKTIRDICLDISVPGGVTVTRPPR